MPLLRLRPRRLNRPPELLDLSEDGGHERAGRGAVRLEMGAELALRRVEPHELALHPSETCAGSPPRRAVAMAWARKDVAPGEQARRLSGRG